MNKNEKLSDQVDTKIEIEAKIKEQDWYKNYCKCLAFLASLNVTDYNQIGEKLVWAYVDNWNENGKFQIKIDSETLGVANAAKLAGLLGDMCNMLEIAAPSLKTRGDYYHNVPLDCQEYQETVNKFKKCLKSVSDGIRKKFGILNVGGVNSGLSDNQLFELISQTSAYKQAYKDEEKGNRIISNNNDKGKIGGNLGDLNENNEQNKQERGGNDIIIQKTESGKKIDQGKIILNAATNTINMDKNKDESNNTNNKITRPDDANQQPIITDEVKNKDVKNLKQDKDNNTLDDQDKTKDNVDYKCVYDDIRASNYFCHNMCVLRDDKPETYKKITKYFSIWERIKLVFYRLFVFFFIKKEFKNYNYDDSIKQDTAKLADSGIDNTLQKVIAGAKKRHQNLNLSGPDETNGIEVDE